ncbi:MAG: hypothetical protein M3373_09520 [Gemmatimonadota bacterium]|nr:hypothetical protein [Gemmatimonadota bacterium]
MTDPSSFQLSNSSLFDSALRAGVAFGLESPIHPDAARLAAQVALAFGPSAAAVVHYGSHAQRSGAGPESAHDFFVIVDRYAEAYRHLRTTTQTRYSPATATALAKVLPPNVIRLVLPVAGRRMQAKCAVLSTADLARLCSPSASDHFTQGRLFQQTQLAWVRDSDSRAATIDALVSARAETFRWGRPYLPARFDVELYCRTLLEASFAAEIRPEGNERVSQLLAAQRDTLIGVYGVLLQHLAASTILVRDENVYALRTPVSRLEGVRIRLYFARSKARATLRWAKHIVLYEDWLDYIVQKIARRSGRSVELTERERRWPLIFLWPRAIDFIRTRPQRRGPDAA